MPEIDRSQFPKQWTSSVSCPVHGVAVPMKEDGTLGAYCPKCLGEAANALERWGYAWRLRGYAIRAKGST